jgi:hypothetical protein
MRQQGQHRLGSAKLWGRWPSTKEWLMEKVSGARQRFRCIALFDAAKTHFFQKTNGTTRFVRAA